MTTIEDKLILIDSSNQDAIEYGRQKTRELIESNLAEMGARCYSIQFTNEKIMVSFGLENSLYTRVYDNTDKES